VIACLNMVYALKKMQDTAGRNKRNA